jgi:hypothetical protein
MSVYISEAFHYYFSRPHPLVESNRIKGKQLQKRMERSLKVKWCELKG